MKIIAIKITLAIVLSMLVFSCGTDHSGDTGSSSSGASSTDPRIEVKRLSALVYSGSGPYPFGNVAQGSSSNPVEFTIENSGGGALTISSVEITGTDEADFSHDFSGEQTIEPGSSLTFNVTFSPTTSILGSRYAQININHNDFNSTNPFVVKLTGSVTKEVSEVNIKDNLNNTILSGGLKNFGSITVGGNTSVAFKIENLGGAALTLLSGPAYVTSSSGEFVVTAQPASGTIAGSSSDSFTIQFTPASAGYKTATITIVNDDADEGTYTFTVAGTGIAVASTAPEINIKQGGTNLPDDDDDALPYVFTAYSFGSVTADGDAGTTSANVDFTIQNVGNAALTITGVTIPSGDTTEFDIVTNYSGAIAAGGTGTFTLRFDPTSAGTKTALVSVASNDADEATYTFAITGTGTWPQIAATPALYNYGSVPVNTTSSNVSFLIQNDGNETLSITGTSNVGGNIGDFTVNSPGGGVFTVPAGSNRTITASFTPSATGARSTTLTLTNNAGAPLTIPLSGTGAASEINVQNAVAANVADGGAQAVTNAAVGASVGYTFTIQNTSAAKALSISNISLSGTNADQFNLDLSATSMTVGASGSTTFTVNFAPTATGLKNAVITILNDDDPTDADTEDSYTISISATASGAPEIEIQDAATNRYPEDVATYDFGNQLVNAASGSMTFIIKNLGTTDLTLSGSPKVAIGGAAAADYSVVSQPSSPIGAGYSSTFAIKFTPSTTGVRNATVSIANDDATGGENPKTYNLTGTGVAPEIQITAPATAHGGSYSFANTAVSANTDVVFTITNSGTATLNLTGAPNVSIAGSAEFSVLAQPGSSTIASGGGTTTFTLRFLPTSFGAKTATVTIPNDDSDESPYQFTINGTGTAPEINVVPDTHNFGNVPLGMSSTAIPITIQNVGNSNLTIASIVAGGVNPGDFSASAYTTPVAGGGSATFTITFTPTATGNRSATFTINNNDADEGAYVVNVSGSGNAPEIEITAPATAHGGSYSFANTAVSANTDVVFTITNSGTATLNLTGAPNVSIAGSAEFSVLAQPGSSTIASGGGTTTFTLRFLPTSYGTKTATVTIPNDDSNESPYQFTINGTGTAPEINVVPMNIAFGSQPINTSSTLIPITIENQGNSNLVIGAGTIVLSDLVNYTISTTGPLTITPGTSQTVSVTYNPTTAAAHPATVTITSNDADESPLVVNLSGTGLGTPEINIKQTVTIAHDGGAGAIDYNFGNVNIGSSLTKVFTIENLGYADLTGVSVSLTGNAQFTVGSQPSATVAPQSSAFFTLVYTPTAQATNTTQVSVASNDADENPYTFDVDGSGVSADIEITAPATANGASYTFADTVVSANTDVVFTLANISTTSVLNLTGSPNRVMVSGSSEFTVTVQPAATVAVFPATTTFTVRFLPTSVGTKTATITIPNNDFDENPYQFTVSGTGTAPEINIVPSTYDFGEVGVGYSSDAIPFTVQNLGNSNLTIASITKAGANPGDFTVSSYSTPIAGGGSTTFTITFSPTASGTRAATITVNNNDSDEGAYNISVIGSGSSGSQVVDDGSAGPYNIGNYTSVAVIGSKIYIAYYDSTNLRLLFKKSADGGSTWGATVIVDAGPNVGQYLDIAAVADRASDGDDIYISYYDSATNGGVLKIAYSIDGGTSFTTGVADNNANNVGQYSSIAVVPDSAAQGSDKVYASYYNATATTLVFAKSIDGCATLPFPAISTPDATASRGQYSSIAAIKDRAADGDDIYISYYDSVTNAGNLVFIKSVDGGATFAGAVTVDADASTDGQYSSIAVVAGVSPVSDKVYTVYYDTTTRLRFAKSTDGGATFANDLSIDATGNTGQYTSLAAKGSVLYVSYYDVANGYLKFAKSFNAGANWNVTTLDANATSGTGSSIFVDGTNVYVSYNKQNDLGLIKSVEDGDDW